MLGVGGLRLDEMIYCPFELLIFILKDICFKFWDEDLFLVNIPIFGKMCKLLSPIEDFHSDFMDLADELIRSLDHGHYFLKIDAF